VVRFGRNSLFMDLLGKTGNIYGLGHPGVRQDSERTHAV
jgi:hypothetical protein